MHPETKHGGAPGVVEGKGGRGKLKGKKSKDCTVQSCDGQSPEAFVKETARVTQSHPSTVSRSAQIGENLCRKAQQLLAGTPVEDRKTGLPRSEAGRRRLVVGGGPDCFRNVGAAGVAGASGVAVSHRPGRIPALVSCHSVSSFRRRRHQAACIQE